MGVLDMLIYMPNLQSRFGERDKDAALSIIPVMLGFLISCYVIAFYPGPEIAHIDTLERIRAFSLRFAIIWPLYMGAVLGFSIIFERHGNIFQFITAHNWFSAFTSVPFLGLYYYLVDMQGLSVSQASPLFWSIYLYFLSCVAYAAMRIFKIPWSLGAFIALIGLYIDDASFNILISLMA